MFLPVCTSTPCPPSPPTSWLPAAPNLPAQSLLGELMDLQASSQDKKLNRLMNNQEATLKLMENFIRETRAFRDLVSNCTRESREKKCCGCHCITKRARVSPKPYSGRLTMISTGDLGHCAFGDGAVGDFEDCMVENFGDGAEGDFRDGIGDDAIASGSSNSVGEDGNGFLL